MQKAAVLGAGAWGTALAKVLADKGFSTALWARRADLVAAIASSGVNERYLPGARLPATLTATADLGEAVSSAELLVLVVPSHAMRDVMERAAQHGVSVKILVPGVVDHELVRQASRAGFGRMLRAGIQVYEYRGALLHAKTMVVDGVWSSVGSVNFDNRSFQLHDEATLCVRSEAFAAELTEQFERDLGDSEKIESRRWERRGARRRAAENATRLARREL